jgi:aspartyl-tRNA(Asn)/glutamyl-tRNA(Gln) amidotransferase subunit A
VADCALLDGVLANDPTPLAPFAGTLRLCTADDVMLADADESVRNTYARAKEALSRAGAHIEALPAGAFAEMDAYSARGSFSSAEAWQRFGELIKARPHDIDPRIAERITRGRTITAGDWIQNLRARAEMMARFAGYMQNYDALIAPTTPIIAPPIAEMEDDDKFRRANGLILRNPMIANLLDAPSLTLPCHEKGSAPVGLMLIGPHMSDHRLLSIGATMERILESDR